MTDPEGDVLGDSETHEILLIQMGTPLLYPLIVTPLTPL